MIARRFIRHLNQFTNFSEIGKLPPQIQTHLDCLNNPNNYKPWIREKPVKALGSLYRAAQKILNVNTVVWDSLLPVKQAITGITPLVEDYSMATIKDLMASLSVLKINDEKLWLAIEKHIIKDLSISIDEKNIYDIVNSFHKFNRGSDEFWHKLKEIIKERLCPDNNLNARSVSIIITALGKRNKIDDRFLIALESQVYRVAKSLHGEELSNIIYIFGLKNLGNEELFTIFNKQVRENKHMMDPQGIAHCLASFIKVGQGTSDLYDDLEKEIILKQIVKPLGLGDITGLLFTYARYMAFAVKNTPKRQEFVLKLAEMLKKKEREFFTTSDITIVHNLWSLFRLNLLQDQDLTNSLISIYNSRKLKENPDFTKLNEDILKHI